MEGQQCSWMGGLNIAKIIILPKLIHRFNEILIKTPMVFFSGNGKANSKIHMDLQGPLESQTVFKQRNEVERLRFPNFKTY